MKVRGGASYVLLSALTVVWVAAVVAVPPKPQTKPVPKVDFSRDVLPILSEKCFKCHGPDTSGRQADLRLDRALGAFSDRGGRWAIVPHKPQDSLVVKRINNAGDPMPPRSSGKSLTKQEIATLTKWISEGAEYSQLWSFKTLPATVPVPKVSGSWPRNDLDRFVLARLQKAKLTPGPAAPRERLLRRVTLDLTGLPPTESEISAYLADKRPDAYERVVDRLLASPHFGERVAVDWLDAARYSDSYGYQSDLISPTWPYRDWVVKSFNQNLPYDQFLTDQIAGDLLPHPTRDQRLATAFNRLHRQSNEGGSIPLEFKVEYGVDRVSTFGTAVLGLTIGCARCHDHKFDPITQKEFYQLYAYFDSINEYGLLLSTEIVPTPSMLLPTPAQDAQLKQTREASDQALQKLAATEAEAGSRYAAWLASGPKKLEIPGIFGRFALDKATGNKFENSVDGKRFAEKLEPVELVPGRGHPAPLLNGDNGIALRGLPARERWDAFTWSLWIDDARPAPGPIVLMHRTGGTDVGFCGFDLLLEDGYLTARVFRAWPGNAVAIKTRNRIAKDAWTQVAWSYDGSARAAGLKLYVNGKPADTVVLNDKLWKNIYAYGDLGDSGGDWAIGQRFREAGFKGGKVQDVTYADRALSDLEVADLFDNRSLSGALAAPDQHATELQAYYVSALDGPSKTAREEVKKAQIALTNAENPVYEVEVMEETPTPVPTYLLARGQYDAPRTPATLVHRDVPKSLPPLKAAGANNRLALARWVTQPNHPLTARVAVNRFWQMIFGVGLVETSDNFGVQGSQPTNPALLDYLARHFVTSGWNVKGLIKEMVLSSTYRQDSARTAKLLAVDPDNHLFARGPSTRLTAEMVRDTVLTASGLLNDKVGGEPVNPYQPGNIWQENNTMSPAFVQSKGADLYRRSIYSTWKRTTPVPSILLFDATSREACSIRRPPTNTPLQALVLLNDVQFVEAARVLAEHLLKQPGGDSSRIELAFERLAGRRPDSREMAVLMLTLAEQRTQFKADPKLAAKLIAVGDSKADAKLDPLELASMTVAVQTVMNSDAVIWKR